MTKRCCVSVTAVWLLAHASVTSSSGTPGWLTKVGRMRSTGLPDVAGDRLGEVLRRRVAVGMRLQVGVDALLEGLGADVAARPCAAPPRLSGRRWRRTPRRFAPASSRPNESAASTSANRGRARSGSRRLRRRRRSSRGAPRPAACSPSRSRTLRSARCRPTTASSRDRRTTGAPSRGRESTRSSCGCRPTPTSSPPADRSRGRRSRRCSPSRRPRNPARRRRRACRTDI